MCMYTKPRGFKLIHLFRKYLESFFSGTGVGLVAVGHELRISDCSLPLWSSQERQLTRDHHDGIKVGHCPRIAGPRWFSGRNDTQTHALRMNRTYPGGEVVEREREKRERSRAGKGVPGGGNSVSEGPGICGEAENLGELEHREGEGGATEKVTHLNSECSEG